MSRLKAIGSMQPAQSAFEEFMHPHFDTLYRRAYRLTHNVADAEDLVQELCIRVYPRFSELAWIDNPKIWLLRVLYRLYVDWARARQRSQLVSLSAIEHDDIPELTCTADTPEEQADAILTQQRLLHAMQRLSQEEQALLTLHEVEGYSIAELEQISELPQGTLKSRLHRARIKLGRLLKREENVVELKTRGTSDELPRNRRSVG